MRRIMSSVALLLVLLGSAAVATQDAHDHHHHHHHDCIHDRIKDLPGRGINAPRINVSYDFDTASMDPAVRRGFKSKASTYASIRVSFFWDSGDCTTSGSTSCGHCTAAGNSVTDFSGNTVTCGTDDVLTDAKKTYILTYLMPAAATFYAQALSVVPVSGNLILSGSPSTCGSSPGTPIPSAHTSTGIANTDLAIYVTAVPVKGGGSTAAWASACRYDSAGRPVAAQVNFVPSQLSNAGTLNTVQLDTDQHIAIHELGHALGFASPWFDSKKGYLNLDGVTYTVSTGLTTVTSSTLGKSVTYLSSPRVAREVQNYFGCTSIPGGEIEDQGGSGTQGSHWEKRVFQQDTMSGIASTTELFHSRFTLAMLEDTGHYVANYNVADPRYSWGASKGCTFLTTKCNSLSSTTVSSSQEFCFETTAGGTGSYCTYDRLARGYCDVTTYSSSLPSYFQYYSSNSALGADVSLQDYCPVVLPYSNRICIDSSLQPTAGSSSDLYGETYSVNSRCFDSTLIKSGYSSTSSGNTVRCFAVSCVSGVLVLTISGTTVKCPTDGTAGSADLSGLSGFKGSVTCPAASFYGCTSSSSGSLGTTTAAGTVTASAGATSVPTTPAPPTPAPTPAPPTPLSNCNSTQPANDVFAPNTCTGYTTCDATYCTCVGGSGSTAAACTGTTTKGCGDVVPCLTQYYACLSALENARSNSSDPCNAFAVALHSATLLSAASSYSGSALQQSCQYNLCRITNTSSRIRSCSFGSASGFVCVDPLATTVAPATTPSPTTPTPTPSVTYQITATITLSGSAWATLVNDPTQYTSLLRAITFDLAALLSVSYTFVTVFKASVGSLVITFGVQSGSGKSTSSLVTSVNSAQSSTTWLSNTASVYSTVSSETLTVTSATVTATAAPTTTSPGASSAAVGSTAVAVIAAAIVAYAL